MAITAGFFGAHSGGSPTPAVEPLFDKYVNADSTTAGKVYWFMAPVGEPKKLNIENGGDFDIQTDAALLRGVNITRIAGSARSVQLNVIGNLALGPKDSLPEIRLRPKGNKGGTGQSDYIVRILVLPPKKITVSFFNVEDTPSKPGQPSRRTTHSEDTVKQMITEANRILQRQANIEIQNGGLGAAKVDEELPTKLYFTKALTDREHKSRDWREKFVGRYLTGTSAQRFSMFFVTDFDLEGQPGAQAFSERIEANQRWYSFQKESTGGNDAKSLAHETCHTLLGDFYAASKGHSPYKDELMWPTLEESGERIYLETARTINARAPTAE